MDKRLLKLVIGIFLTISLLIMAIAIITADDKVLDGGDFSSVVNNCSADSGKNDE